MNNLQTFSYESAKIRTSDVNGEPWFVAKDVCTILGLANVSQALSSLDDDEKGITTNDTLGGEQRMLTVNETGLYALIFASRKEKACEFKRWVRKEVIPSIRKTGAYSLPARIDREKSKEIRNGITDIWQERGAKKWDFKNLTHAEYKALGYKKVSEVKKGNMTRLEIAKLAGLEMFESMKLERNAEIAGYHGLKDSILETGAAIETALNYIENYKQVRAS